MFVVNPYMGGIIATGGTISYANGKTIHTFTADDTFQVTSGAGLIEIIARGGGGAGGRPGGWTYGSPGGAASYVYGKMTVAQATALLVKIGGGGTFNIGAWFAAHGGGACCYNSSDNSYGGGGGGYSGIFQTAETFANAILIAAGGGGGGASRAGTGNQGGGGDQDGVSAYNAPYYGRKGTILGAGADASCDSPNTAGNQGPLQGGNCRVNSYGGAGGGGYYGGSGGGYNEPNTMGGGGGGASYTKPGTILSADIQAGNLTTPGNSAHASRGTAGNPGAASNVGSPGKVIIMY